MEKDQNKEIIIKTFWEWFFGNREKTLKPGVYKLFSYWIILDIFIGILFTIIVDRSLNAVSESVLFPLASLFIGISLTWGGSAQAILDSDEIRLLGDHHQRGYAEYPYSFQSAVLVIFITLILWGIASIGIFEKNCIINIKYLQYIIKFILYSFISFSLRICWQMVSFSHELLLAKEKIIRINKSKNNDDFFYY